MKPHIRSAIAFALLALSLGSVLRAEDASSLRLVPFPKEVSLDAGAFSLDQPLFLQVPDNSASPLFDLIGAELQRARPDRPPLRKMSSPAHILRLTGVPGGTMSPATFRAGAGPEDYVLRVDPTSVTIWVKEPPGLLHGTQTLCQLIRANRRGQALASLTIRDWPMLRWRCFQDDLTRGPSSRLETLKHEIGLGAYLKMNLFTYYMEYQYAFKKHPLIGPQDGSLQPDELRQVVQYAKPLGIDILGNQQSFAHFSRILAHEQYAPLRENADVLTPAKEGTYQLLDDLYSEVCPILPFEMFNVCCDETWGLGNGPSKELAGKIGVGGVYTRHIVRVHDLLRNKYRKRMMMWGDIILQHPGNLKDIPKDTVMLTWGYDPRPSFEEQIIPFAKSGYEFLVCPGVSNWSRILPDFAAATVNIRNFVRDGVKHGAMGMLSTSWEDDGESLKGVIWHGHAWAAECAWNGSTTDPAAFNRRVGAVLFGEKADRFGQAVELLAQTHAVPTMKGMNNSRFWDVDLMPNGDPAAIEAAAKRLLALTVPAIEHLQACRREATINAELLDAYLQGAGRMQLIGQRMLDGLEASRTYALAREAPKEKALELLGKVEAVVRRNRDAHESLGREFQRIWLSESKPYALDWTMKRYEKTVRWHDDVLTRLAAARKDAEAGKPVPPQP